MTEQEARKILKLIQNICESDDIWHDIQYVKHPDLRMIKVEMSIKIAPKHTRKMEVVR